MPKISVTLILFTVLLLLSAALWLKRREAPGAAPFSAMVFLAAVQSLMVSLRWDFGLDSFRALQILLAAALPGFAWLCFRSAASGGALVRRANAPHLLPVALAAAALAFLPGAIDVILVATFCVYGASFLRLALSGDAGFDQTAFEGVFNMRRAVSLLAFALLSSALVDVLVILDFLRLGGQHAATLIGIGNMVWLLALGVSAVLGGAAFSAGEEETEPEQVFRQEPEDQRIAEDIHHLLTEQGLAKRPGLTLSRLARRAALPSRAVSVAINRVHGRNVSQYINDIRIEEACRLLRDTDMSVTQAIYESGFQTKSNFNREFLRVTGKTPRDWRKDAQAARPSEPLTRN
jgi:AraC-like DNA-binding protein